jgi:hypothetical protein
MDIQDFKNSKPTLLPEQFLTGELRGWGVVETVLGRLIRRFTVEAEGRWDEERQLLSLNEEWRFDNGHVDRLRWRIRRLSSGTYRGEEERLVEEAQGEQSGAAFRWRYTRRVPQKDGSELGLDFDDWFWRIDEDTLIIKGTTGRFGLPFATLHATYQRLDAYTRPRVSVASAAESSRPLSL